MPSHSFEHFQVSPQNQTLLREFLQQGGQKCWTCVLAKQNSVQLDNPSKAPREATVTWAESVIWQQDDISGCKVTMTYNQRVVRQTESIAECFLMLWEVRIILADGPVQGPFSQVLFNGCSYIPSMLHLRNAVECGPGAIL